MYFFMICLLVEFIMEHGSTENKSAGHIAGVSVLIFVIFMLLKTLAYYLNYKLYFLNYPIPNQEVDTKNVVVSDEEDMQKGDIDKEDGDSAKGSVSQLSNRVLEN